MRRLSPGFRATGLALLVTSLYAFDVRAQGTEAPSFSRQVQPIFDANCVACHQTGAAQQGLVLESSASYAIVGKRSSEAPMGLVVPGAPDASYLLQKVKGTQLKANGRGDRMPLGGMLEEGDVETIRRWILGGAKNN